MIIAQETNEVMRSYNPATGKELEGEFNIDTEKEIDEVMRKADAAFHVYNRYSGARKAEFLDAISDEIMALGDRLIERACLETALPEGRIKGERGRTVNQLKMFAQLLREGSWVEATIDIAQPERAPVPKPDLRKMLVPTGPVVVFSASNFPLAFSTAGGDTASALAAGNPVVLKAHPSHLGTNQLVADAIITAAKNTNMPDGVFSSVQGNGFSIGQYLVKHPIVKSVAFTGSYAGGKALFDLANQREEPIPVFAEMGSINPVIILPNKMDSEYKALAATYADSITVGVGQFCTNPGLLITLDCDKSEVFVKELGNNIATMSASTMLNEGISEKYEVSKESALAQSGVKPIHDLTHSGVSNCGNPTVAEVNAADFISNPSLQHEVFGPFSLVVKCFNDEELGQVIAKLQGQLTATVMGTEEDIITFTSQIKQFGNTAGRLIFNGVPTGVEVAHSMHHGGPFPASTDSRFTSVGADAIKRFVRPMSYQNTPQYFLPDELKDSNPLNIYRKQDGIINNKGVSVVE